MTLTLKQKLDSLLSSDLTYSSDLAAALLHTNEQQLITLARKHGLAYRMIVWDPHGDIQCLKFGTEAERQTKLSAGIAFSASGEDQFWLDETEDKVE